MVIPGWAVFLAIGLLAGWVAGLIYKRGSFGIIGNLVVGVVGALVGGYLFSIFNISMGLPILIRQFVTALVGALVFLFALTFVKR